MIVSFCDICNVRVRETQTGFKLVIDMVGYEHKLIFEHLCDQCWFDLTGVSDSSSRINRLRDALDMIIKGTVKLKRDIKDARS